VEEEVEVPLDENSNTTTEPKDSKQQQQQQQNITNSTHTHPSQPNQQPSLLQEASLDILDERMQRLISESESKFR
jgi:hypothetical protein